MDKFTEADLKKLLSQPGFFFYRPYKSTNPWTKSVFANGASYAPATEVETISFEDVGDVQDQVSNETATISISSGQVLNSDLINDLTGGLYTKETVAGVLVPGATQTLVSGDYGYDTFILLDNQNGDLSEVTVNSLTGGTDGLLVEGIDYIPVQIDGKGWGFSLIAGGNITTLAQDIVVNYDYTPNASVILKRGGIKIMTPIELAYQTVDPDGNFVQFIFYKCTTDGADGHGFSPENSAAPITMDLTFTAKKDTNRAVGDQLFRKVFGGASLG